MALALSLLELTAGEVDVWIAYPDKIEDPDLLDRYEALASDDERRRRRRLRFERDRHERLVSDALMRSALSRYEAREPHEWRMQRNSHGRPDLVPEQAECALRFNVSHATTVVTCAVCRGHEIGVDVERTDRRGETVAIADRYFSAAESAALHALPASQQRRRFFEYWTLKESYIKARGLGLALPLGKFSFVPGERISIEIDPELEDDGSRWQFALHQPSPSMQLALAVRDAPPLTVRYRTAIPLE